MVWPKKRTQCSPDKPIGTGPNGDGAAVYRVGTTTNGHGIHGIARAVGSDKIGHLCAIEDCQGHITTTRTLPLRTLSTSAPSIWQHVHLKEVKTPTFTRSGDNVAPVPPAFIDEVSSAHPEAYIGLERLRLRQVSSVVAVTVGVVAPLTFRGDEAVQPTAIGLKARLAPVVRVPHPLNSVRRRGDLEDDW